MTHRKIAIRITAVACTLLAGAAVADDSKKPAAVAASKVQSAASAGTPGSNPRAVQASTAQPEKKDRVDLVHAKVNLTDAQDDYGIYTKAFDFTDAGTDIIFKMRGQEYELKGFEALQFLVREGYLVHRNGVGMIASDKLKQFLGIRDDTTSGGGGGAAGSGKTGSLLGTGSSGVTLDPTGSGGGAGGGQQKKPGGGGRPTLGGETFDWNLDTYNPDDPTTPEGRRKVLQESLSGLSRQCSATTAAATYRACVDNCSNEMFTPDGRISMEAADRCRDECQAAFEQSKPQVCREADAVQAQLEALQ